MPVALNPGTPFCSLLNSVSTTGASSDYFFRGEYSNHQLQVSTSGATAQGFVLYTSNDCTVWTAIRDNTDLDTTAAAYSGTNPSGVLQLSGSYPWLKVISGTAAAGAFSASIYSSNWHSS